MSKIEFKNIWNITLFDIKCNLKYLLSWTLGLTTFVAIYMLFFPYVEEIGMAKLEVLPEEMLQLFNINDINEMSNYTSYFVMIYSLAMLVTSIFAVNLASTLLVKPEKDKTIEYLYSLTISRSEIYLSKLLTTSIWITIALYGMGFSGIICGALFNYDTYSFTDILLIIKYSAIIPYLFAFITICLGSIKTDLGSTSFGSFIIFVVYLIGYLGTLVGEKFVLLTYVSPFVTACSSDILSIDTNSVIAIAIYYFIAIFSLFIGYTFYKKRDIQM